MFLRANVLKPGIIISDFFDNTAGDGFRVDLFPPAACDFAHVDDQVLSGLGIGRFVLHQSNIALFTPDHGIVVEWISGHG